MCDDLQAWPQLVALFMPKCVEAQWSSETPNERWSTPCLHPQQCEGTACLLVVALGSHLHRPGASKILFGENGSAPHPLKPLGRDCVTAMLRLGGGCVLDILG